MIKAIIFDVDDTIIDFSITASPCYQEIAKQLSLPIPPKEKISRLFGTPAKKLIKKFWPKTNPIKFENLTIERIKTKKIKPIKNAVKTIKELHNNYILALLSSKPKKLMYYQLKQIKLKKSLFKFIYAREDVKYHKPSPLVFLRPLKELKLKKEEILYVGDSMFDCIATKKAKIKFVAVLTGHYKKNEFIKKGVKKENILKSIKELPKWLNYFK